MVRFDQDDGNYMLLADEGEGTEGPKTTGNYVWFKVKNGEMGEKADVWTVYSSCKRNSRQLCKSIKGSL